MAKGKTNQPLVIVVAEAWEKHAAIVALREQGHKVYGYHEPSPAKPDLILHPAAHGWDDSLWDYLPAAIAAARARKRRAK